MQALAGRGSVVPVAVDLSGPDGPANLIARAGERIDLLVNNVGVARPRPGGFLSVTDELWRETLELDLMAGVRAIRAALPVMIAGGGGIIVNIGSLNARLPDPLVIDYCAAKAAFGNLAKALSKEFAARHVRVNTIDPGPVATDLWLGDGGVAQVVGNSAGRPPEQIAAAAAAGMLTGRFSRPEEIADLVLFLASDRSANMTGSNVVVDGGMLTTL